MTAVCLSLRIIHNAKYLYNCASLEILYRVLYFGCLTFRMAVQRQRTCEEEEKSMTRFRFITACIACLVFCTIACGVVAAETVEETGAPVASLTATPMTTFVGQNITFDGTASTDNGTITSYDWDFGDGAEDSGETVLHAYDAEGIYNVTLTVTDDEGFNGTDSLEVTIQTPRKAITSLIDTFGGLNAPFGIRNSFIVKLNAATKSLDKEHQKTATNQLNAFVHHAEAQSGKKLTPEEATGFIAYVKEIIGEINKEKSGAASDDTGEADTQGNGKSNKEKGNSVKDSKEKGNSGNNGNGGGKGNGKSK